MVQFLGVEDVIALVKSVGLAPFLRGLAANIEDDFRRWESFEKSPRHAAHSDWGVIELMPIADHERFAFKYVNGHPGNTGRGLQTVAAFGVLANAETGYPILLSEMTLLTALRTAATSAIVGRRLAPPGASTMALIGSGAQAEFQAHAFAELVGIRRLQVFDTDPAAIEKVCRNLEGGPLCVVRARSVAEAVEGAHVITTATADKRRATILSDNLVGAGVHINAVGGDCPGKTELQADILLRGRVFVEYEPQTRIEGEIQQLPFDFPVHGVSDLLRGETLPRHRDEVTVFDSVGFALEDLSALRFVSELAQDRGLGRELDLIAAPRDPKDLFGCLINGVDIPSSALPDVV